MFNFRMHLPLRQRHCVVMWLTGYVNLLVNLKQRKNLDVGLQYEVKTRRKGRALDTKIVK